MEGDLRVIAQSLDSFFFQSPMTEGSEERVTVRGKVPDREISEREGVWKSCPGYGGRLHGALTRGQPARTAPWLEP